MTKRMTGSWVIRSSDLGYVVYLQGGGISFGDAADALVFPTKTAAREAMKGYARARGEVITYERSVLHEESARAREDWR